MRKHRLTIHFFASVTTVLAFAIAAHAVSVTFVSTAGNDANTAVNCSASAPCRTFAAAETVTSSGGEIVVMNSGGYGAFTISQSLTVSAVGVNATITQATSGSDAITINTTGSVTIIGLNLYGEATGSDGIRVEDVSSLVLFNLTAQNFVNNGIDFTSTGSLAVYNSSFSSNGHDGLLLENASATGYANSSFFNLNTSAGADSSKGNLTVVDSSATANKYAYYANGGTLSLDHDRAVFNTTGLEVSPTTGPNGAGKLYFSNCLVAANTTAYSVGSGGTLAGTSPGTTVFTPGQAKVGTLSAATALR